MGDDLRAAIVIAARILRQRVRDRSAIVFAILTPLGLALAFAVLIPNELGSFHAHFVVVDNDRGPFAAHLVDDAFGALATAGIADTERVAAEPAARDMLERGRAGAVIVIPAGFSAAISSASSTRIEVLGGQLPGALEVARAVVDRFATEAGATQLLVVTAAGTGLLDADAVAAATTAMQQPSPIAVDIDELTARQADRATFYAAAMAIMFVFFATQYGALAIHADRQTGTLTRLLAAPIRPRAILLGAAMASFALGVLAMSFLAVVTTLLVHATWGQPLLVGILIVSGAVAASGISLVVASIARTPQQAGAVNSMVALSMAAVGGVFLPLSP